MNKGQVVVRILIVILFLGAIGCGGYLGFKQIKVVKQKKEAAQKVSFADMNRDLDMSDVGYSKDVTNVLLIGTDKKSGDSEEGRSDAILIFSVDNLNSQLKITSLMRDTYVDIPGYGENRLYEAYAFGGEKLLYQTIVQNFKVRLDGYLTVDMENFSTIINRLGGIPMDVTAQEVSYMQRNYQGQTPANLKVGTNLFDGAQAVAYCRYDADSLGEFGRTKRQRMFLNAIYKQMKSTNITELIPVVSELMKVVKTDLNLDEIKSIIAGTIKVRTDTIYTSQFPKEGTYECKYKDGKTVLAFDQTQAVWELQNFMFNMYEVPVTTEAPAASTSAPATTQEQTTENVDGETTENTDGEGDSTENTSETSTETSTGEESTEQ